MSIGDEPDALDYYSRGASMSKKHRTETERFVRVLWHCAKCDSQYSRCTQMRRPAAVKAGQAGTDTMLARCPDQCG
jgi:hypothetical protein